MFHYVPHTAYPRFSILSGDLFAEDVIFRRCGRKIAQFATFVRRCGRTKVANVGYFPSTQFLCFFYFSPTKHLAPFLARLQTWRAIIFCLSVCLWPALLPFSINRFWRKLVTRTLLWSSLTATIMVQIGHRGTAWHLFENFKKFFKKSQKSNFKILVHHFYGRPM